METFLLRATLSTPIIQRGYITLDALLMAVLQKADVSAFLHCEQDLYFASASWLVEEPASETGKKPSAAFVASMRPEHSPHWVDLIKPNSKRGDLTIGLARQREAGNVLNSYRTRSATSVEWYATGDANAVLNAVQHVPFIGKRRTSGYGEVLRWEIEPGDLDGIVGYAGEPLRPVPANRWTAGGDWVAQEAAWKAPYWDLRNRTKCFVPLDASL
jgi:hypothetical protein